MSSIHTKTFKCEIEGPMARWTRPDSQADPISHRVPPPDSIRGLLSGIHHSRTLFFYPVKLDILPYVERDLWTKRPLGIACTKGIQFAPVSQYMINGKKQRWFGTPASVVYLYQVRYRLEFCVEGPLSHLEEFEKRLMLGASDNILYLGVRECRASVSGVLTDDPPLDINFIEPSVRLATGGPVADLRVEHGSLVYPLETRKALATRREQTWRAAQGGESCL